MKRPSSAGRGIYRPSNSTKGLFVLEEGSRPRPSTATVRHAATVNMGRSMGKTGGVPVSGTAINTRSTRSGSKPVEYSGPHVTNSHRDRKIMSRRKLLNSGIKQMMRNFHGNTKSNGAQASYYGTAHAGSSSITNSTGALLDNRKNVVRSVAECIRDISKGKSVLGRSYGSVKGNPSTLGGGGGGASCGSIGREAAAYLDENQPPVGAPSSMGGSEVLNPRGATQPYSQPFWGMKQATYDGYSHVGDNVSTSYNYNTGCGNTEKPGRRGKDIQSSCGGLLSESEMREFVRGYAKGQGTYYSRPHSAGSRLNSRSSSAGRPTSAGRRPQSYRRPTSAYNRRDSADRNKSVISGGAAVCIGDTMFIKGAVGNPKFAHLESGPRDYEHLKAHRNAPYAIEQADGDPRSATDTDTDSNVQYHKQFAGSHGANLARWVALDRVEGNGRNGNGAITQIQPPETAKHAPNMQNGGTSNNRIEIPDYYKIDRESTCKESVKEPASQLRENARKKYGTQGGNTGSETAKRSQSRKTSKSTLTELVHREVDRIYDSKEGRNRDSRVSSKENAAPLNHNQRFSSKASDTTINTTTTMNVPNAKNSSCNVPQNSQKIPHYRNVYDPPAQPKTVTLHLNGLPKQAPPAALNADDYYYHPSSNLINGGTTQLPKDFPLEYQDDGFIKNDDSQDSPRDLRKLNGNFDSSTSEAEEYVRKLKKFAADKKLTESLVSNVSGKNTSYNRSMDQNRARLLGGKSSTAKNYSNISNPHTNPHQASTTLSNSSDDIPARPGFSQGKRTKQRPEQQELHRTNTGPGSGNGGKRERPRSAIPTYKKKPEVLHPRDEYGDYTGYDGKSFMGSVVNIEDDDYNEDYFRQEADRFRREMSAERREISKRPGSAAGSSHGGSRPQSANRPMSASRSEISRPQSANGRRPESPSTTMRPGRPQSAGRRRPQSARSETRLYYYNDSCVSEKGSSTAMDSPKSTTGRPRPKSAQTTQKDKDSVVTNNSVSPGRNTFKNRVEKHSKIAKPFRDHHRDIRENHAKGETCLKKQKDNALTPKERGEKIKKQLLRYMHESCHIGADDIHDLFTDNDWEECENVIDAAKKYNLLMKKHRRDHRPKSAYGRLVSTEEKLIHMDREKRERQEKEGLPIEKIDLDKIVMQDFDSLIEKKVKSTATWFATPTTACPFAPLNKRYDTQKIVNEYGFRPNSSQIWGPGPPKVNAAEEVRDSRWTYKSGVFTSMLDPGTKFRKLFERGDLPIGIKQGCKLSLQWKIPFPAINTSLILPVLIDGIKELTFPFNFVSYTAAMDLIRNTEQRDMIPAIGAVIIAIHDILITKNRDNVAKVIKLLREIIQLNPDIGELLVPYYKYLLPTFNLYISMWRNLDGHIDYGQQKEDGRNTQSLSMDIVNLLEKVGGPHAFFNIKYLIPTYESCVYAI